MIVVDVNLLLYAYNASAEQHRRARAWLEETLSGQEPMALSWVVILAFLRLSTNRRIFPNPLSMREADDIVDNWLRRSQVLVLNPSERHWQLLRETMSEGKVSGALITDAHLAALTVEHGATLYTTDRDFARFSKLRFRNPLDEA
ncbi:MAG: type II toxin-antitoxin system VapC family toxin [Acidobacteria bacterium]|nr:type II toxin-antitoxin system VapC family toxin [Acidobacteriota bacterium]